MVTGNPATMVPAILLATDLSSRCDRAFERACVLAAAWGATLHVVTAVEGDVRQPSWRSTSNRALDRMRADVAEALGVRPLSWEPAVAVGPVHEVVIDTAARVAAELIVIGAAGNELLGRHRPGRTVETLIRESPVPVLVVRRRAIREYRRIFLPTDYSQAAEFALLRAIALFPHAQFTLLHGYRVPFAGFLSDVAHRGEMEELALRQQAEFIARVEAKTGRSGRVLGFVECGEPGRLVADYVGETAPDLMVLGAHDHAGIWGALSVDVAGRLLMMAGCDVLVVPEASELRRPTAAMTR